MDYKKILKLMGINILVGTTTGVSINNTINKSMKSKTKKEKIDLKIRRLIFIFISFFTYSVWFIKKIKLLTAEE